MITLEEAKKIKCDFVNMQQYYNGYEITDMWNIMCEQLFDSIEKTNCTNCKYFYSQGSGFGLCNKGVSSDFKIGTFACNKHCNPK